MPREQQDPHLIKRSPRYDKTTGKLTHKGTWIIKHGNKQTATGCSFSNAEEAAVAKEDAKLKLHEYNVERYAKHDLPEQMLTSQVKIGDLIAFYLQEQADDIAAMKKARRKEHVDQIGRLMEFWGDRYVSEIKRKTSEQYQKDRSPSVVRNELITLRAIVNFAASEDKLKKYDDELNYAIPKPIPSRLHYFSQEEVIALYKGAMRKRHTWREGRKERLEELGQTIGEQPVVMCQRVAAHIAKFIIVAVVTGTRADRIQQASFVQEPGRPWIDLDTGYFYRAAEGEMVPENKRADPILIPDRLLRAMKRWHRGDGKTPGCRYLIEYQGRPVDCRKGFYTLKNEVLGEKRAAQVNRHTLKHTCVTWLLQSGVTVEEVADYVSTTPKIIRRVYRHVIPGEYSSVHRVWAKQPKVGSTTRHQRNADAA